MNPSKAAKLVTSGSYRLSRNPIRFDPDEMRQLFDAGYQFALSGRPWRNTPPGVEPHEQRLPRSGIHFVVPEAGQTSPPGAEADKP